MFALEMNVSPQTSSAEDFFELAMCYCLGRGVAQDNVVAHKWFNIAAMKGNKSALQYRCELACEMSPSQVAEALRQARAFLTVH